MKLTALTVAVAAAVMFAQSAYAREHQHRHGQHYRLVISHRTYSRPQSNWFAGGRSGGAPPTNGLFAAANGSFGQSEVVVYRGHDRGRPRAWCGWEMRRLVGADPGPSFNLARNWAHWGRPGAAGIGAVVVWSHHVGKIVGRENGEWIVESGNDGHALRSRARSIGGAIAIRWG